MRSAMSPPQNAARTATTRSSSRFSLMRTSLTHPIPRPPQVTRTEQPDGLAGPLDPRCRQRHLSALEDAAYCPHRQVFEHKRARTWLSLTPAGRTAFESHLDALRRIVGGHADSVD